MTSLGLFGWVPDTSEEYRRLRVAEARRRRPELSREQLERRGRYLADRASGEFYERVAGATLHGHGWMPDGVDASAAFYVADEGPVFLARPTAPPFTVEQLEAAEQARERADLREAERRREYLDRQPRRPLTLADLDEHMPLTLRQAHEILLELGCRSSRPRTASSSTLRSGSPRTPARTRRRGSASARPPSRSPRRARSSECGSPRNGRCPAARR